MRRSRFQVDSPWRTMSRREDAMAGDESVSGAARITGLPLVFDIDNLY
jgi:hypothetical protein